jgi:hypothetical protein
MTLNRWIAIWTAFAVLAFPALSLADHHEAGEEAAAQHSDKAGGKAAEHRSEMADEKSNAQWDEDNEGRPEKARGEDDEERARGGQRGDARFRDRRPLWARSVHGGFTLRCADEDGACSRGGPTRRTVRR